MADQNSDRVLANLALAPQIKRLHVFSYLFSAFFSVSYLVFLNASLPLLLTQVLGYPSERAGDVVGSLTLLHELVALPLALFWGHLSDVHSPRLVSSLGHALIALSLPLFVIQSNPYIARVLFASGGSALVTMIPAVLSAMGKIEKIRNEENEPLLDRQLEENSKAEQPTSKSQGSKLAGWVGVTTGTGALVSVFVFLRLPPVIAVHFDVSLSLGLIWTYVLVSFLAILTSIFVFNTLAFPALKADNPPSIRDKIKSICRTFTLAKSSPSLRLAYITSFASRAQTIGVTLFIPLLITTFYLRTDLCPPSTDPAVPKSCPQAYHHIAGLNGTIELLTLLLSPAIPSLPVGVFFPFFLGSLSFIGFSFLPSGDPRHPIVWLYACLLGFAQIGGIVGSLLLVSKARTQLLRYGGEEVAGGIGGGSTVFGGLGILIVGRLGGLLFDDWQGAPFAILAVLDGLVATWAAYTWLKERRK